MIALSLVAAQGTAWAATIDSREGIGVVDGKGSRPAPKPAPVVKPRIGGLINALGVTWED